MSEIIPNINYPVSPEQNSSPIQKEVNFEQKVNINKPKIVQSEIRNGFDMTIVKKSVKRWFRDNINSNATKKAKKAKLDEEDQQDFSDSQFQVMMFVVPYKYKKNLSHIEAFVNNQAEKIIISNGISILVPKENRIQTIREFSIQEQTNCNIPVKIKQTLDNQAIRQLSQNLLGNVSNINKQHENQALDTINENGGKNYLTPEKENIHTNFSNENSVVDEQISNQIEQQDLKDFQQQSNSCIKNDLNEGFIKQGAQYNVTENYDDNQINLINQIQNLVPSKFDKQKSGLMKNKTIETNKHQNNLSKNQQSKLTKNQKAALTQPPLNNQDQNGPSADIKIEQKIIGKFTKEQKQKIKGKEWFKQLQTLSYAQTELTYMAQQLQWFVKFEEKNADPSFGGDMFECKTEVKVIKNNVFQKFEGYCEAKKSKRQSRHHSSIMCLATLYYCLEGLWEKYSQMKKQTPSLCQPKKTDNRDILEEWLELGDSLQKKGMKLQDEQKLSYSVDAYTYVEGLKSCKKQLYYVIAQNNKIFMNPKWKLKNMNLQGWWESECALRYQISEKMFEYRSKCKGKSRRDSQQAVSNRILKRIYTDFPTLFKKFKKIKFERGLN